MFDYETIRGKDHAEQAKVLKEKWQEIAKKLGNHRFGSPTFPEHLKYIVEHTIHDGNRDCGNMIYHAERKDLDERSMHGHLFNVFNWIKHAEVQIELLEQVYS